MRFLPLVACSGLWLMISLPVSAADYNGIWELQAIGQDGSEIQIDQDGDTFLFYRVMHPEFEGKKYTLEHLYKGHLIGTSISGSMYVRDDPKGNFETLRPFEGSVKTDAYIIMDDLPLKLTKPGKLPLPVQPPQPKRKKRGSDAPPLSLLKVPRIQKSLT